MDPFTILVIILPLFVLKLTKYITKWVFDLAVGIAIFASAGEQLVATGYIRDLGSSQLISDYAQQSPGMWFRLGLGFLLMITGVIGAVLSKRRDSKK
jgi:hypothetical protein